MAVLAAAMRPSLALSAAAAASATTLKIVNNTQAAIHVKVTAEGRSYAGEQPVYNAGDNTRTFLDVNSFHSYVNFFRTAPVSAVIDGNAGIRTTTGEEILDEDTVVVTYWQQAPGYFAPSTDVYGEDGSHKGKLQ